MNQTIISQIKLISHLIPLLNNSVLSELIYAVVNVLSLREVGGGLDYYLKVIEYAQLSVEMVAGEKSVLVLELIKFVLRLIVVVRKRRMLLSQVVTDQEAKDTTELLTQRKLQLSVKLNRLQMLSEVIYVTRPLVYAATRNLTLSFVLDAISLNVASYSTTREKYERERRYFMLLVYLLRKPVYSYTKEYLNQIVGLNVPIMSGLLKEYVGLWDKYFYYVNN